MTTPDFAHMTVADALRYQSRRLHIEGREYRRLSGGLDSYELVAKVLDAMGKRTSSDAQLAEPRESEGENG